MSIAVGQVLEGMRDPAHLHRMDVDDQVVIMVGSTPTQTQSAEI